MAGPASWALPHVRAASLLWVALLLVLPQPLPCGGQPLEDGLPASLLWRVLAEAPQHTHSPEGVAPSPEHLKHEHEAPAPAPREEHRPWGGAAPAPKGEGNDQGPSPFDPNDGGVPYDSEGDKNPEETGSPGTEHSGPTPEWSGGLSGGTVAGIVIGTMLAVLVVVASAWICMARQRNSNRAAHAFGDASNL